jgi:N-ethylmaleimide reductase
MSKSLFDNYNLAGINLSSRIVMAPLTRCRAIDGNTPNALMAEYYGQRAGAGLIIAEGTAPSPNGLGYTNIPGLFNEKQAKEWKKSTQAVHDKGGKIFIQLMHTGRVSHIDNLPKGAEVVSASAIAQPGTVKTYLNGHLPYTLPKAMTIEDIHHCIGEFINSSTLAVQAGFDGIEVHASHGYLPNQFINEASNTRTDEYGGSIENRCRFTLDIVKQTIKHIGKEKVGIRLSPFSYADENENPETVIATYKYLASELDKLNIAYVHLSHMGERNPLKFNLWKEIRKIYSGTLILCGDFTKETAQQALDNNEADLIAFGRDFIANPDFVERLKHNYPLAERDNEKWYGNTAEGYTDYPFYNEK